MAVAHLALFASSCIWIREAIIVGCTLKGVSSGASGCRPGAVAGGGGAQLVSGDSRGVYLEEFARRTDGRTFASNEKTSCDFYYVVRLVNVRRKRDCLLY